MDDQNAQDQHRQQIERLLGFPGVGALPAGAIASNLGVPAGAIEAVLTMPVKERRSDGASCGARAASAS